MAESLVEDLCAWLDASPTPFHVVDTAARRLTAAGFVAHSGFADGITDSGYLSVDGALIAWRGIGSGRDDELRVNMTGGLSMTCQPSAVILTACQCSLHKSSQ